MAKKPSNTAAAAPAAPPGGAAPAVLILHGESRFLAMQHTNELKQRLKTLHGDLDVYSFEGASTDVSTVLDELRSPTLMMTHKMVIIDNAEELLVGSSAGEVGPDGQQIPLTPEQERREASKARNRELLEKYCKSPDSGSTLVIRAGEILAAKKLRDAAELVGKVIDCKPLAEPDAVAFCRTRAAAYGVKIEPEAAAMLVGRIGTGAGELDCEIAKLATATFAVGKARPELASTIGVELVKLMTGLSGDEVIYDFQKVLLSERPEQALQQLRTFREVYRHDAVALSIFVCKLVSQIEGVARGMEAGESYQTVSARYKLWGGSGELIGRAAKALRQRGAARLLKESLETDVAMKQTGAEKDRLLELIVLRLSRALNRVLRP